jgi:hypothetical protein
VVRLAIKGHGLGDVHVPAVVGRVLQGLYDALANNFPDYSLLGRLFGRRAMEERVRLRLGERVRHVVREELDLLLQERLGLARVEFHHLMQVLVRRLLRPLFELEVRDGGVPPRGLLAEGELEALDERFPLRTNRGRRGLRGADREPPVLGVTAEVLRCAVDRRLVLHRVMAHADGVHAADERLRGEGIVLLRRIHVIPVEIRVLELADSIMDGLHCRY